MKWSTVMGFEECFDFTSYQQGTDKGRATYCVCLKPLPPRVSNVLFTDQPKWDIYRLKAADTYDGEGAAAKATQNRRQVAVPPSMPLRPPAFRPRRSPRARGSRAAQPP